MSHYVGPLLINAILGAGVLKQSGYEWHSGDFGELYDPQLKSHGFGESNRERPRHGPSTGVGSLLVP